MAWGPKLWRRMPTPFSVLRRNLQRLEELIKRVLATPIEIDASGSSFRPERRVFELWPLVQRLIVDLAAISAKTATQIVNEIPRSLTVFADAGLVSQVFQNLLGNAFKYAANGQVTISASEANGVVDCTVRDNGAGIPLAMLDRVFDKLVTDPAKQGTGLGLAIVKQIVEAHGGEVKAQSVHGVGATFTFTLPAEEHASHNLKEEARNR